MRTSTFFLSVRVKRVGKVRITGHLHRSNCRNVVMFLATFERCMFQKCRIETLGCLLGPIGRGALFLYLSRVTGRLSGGACVCQGGRRVMDVPCTSVLAFSDELRCISVLAMSNGYCRRVSALGGVVIRLPDRFVQARHSCVMGVTRVCHVASKAVRLSGRLAARVTHSCSGSIVDTFTGCAAEFSADKSFR